MDSIDIEPLTVSADQEFAPANVHNVRLYGTLTVNSPAVVNEMTPSHVHINLLVSSRVGKLPSRTFTAPGVHGAGVAGTHGAGVKTPKAADVAAMTAGFVGAVHIPKGMILVNGI